MCRDSETGQFTSTHAWEFGGYGTDVDVDCDGNYVHVQVNLICSQCEKEVETDY